jgi:shikimate kinase
MIEAEMGATIMDIFASQGEAAFRRLESETVVSAMSGTHQVIATGGGAILLERNRVELWGRGFVVYLQTSPETLADRLSLHGATDRPLLKGDLRRRLASLLEARSHYYEQAHAMISTDDASPEAIAERIANAFEHSI